jgi:hypothetical protein
LELDAAHDADHTTGQRVVVVVIPRETCAHRIRLRPVAAGQPFIDDEHGFGGIGILTPGESPIE